MFPNSVRTLSEALRWLDFVPPATPIAPYFFVDLSSNDTRPLRIRVLNLQHEKHNVRKVTIIPFESTSDQKKRKITSPEPEKDEPEEEKSSVHRI
jgi:hypothetical protein